MSKAETIAALAEKHGLTKNKAQEVYEDVFAGVVQAVKKDGRVTIPGFGTFSLGQRAARTGRNPATGETLKIKASKSLRFKQSTSLKDVVNKFKAPAK